MKALGFLLVPALLVLLGFLTDQQWFKPVGLVTALLMVAFYFGYAAARSRAPFLAVGKLTPDNRAAYPVFYIPVENLGPGSVEPIVTVSLEYESGDPLTAHMAFLPQEVHWRGVDKGCRPTLREGEKAAAGVLYVQGVDSDKPTLSVFDIDLTTWPLWETPTLLSKQEAIRASIVATYKVDKEDRGKPKTIKQSYVIRPSGNSTLKYAVERQPQRRFRTGK